MDWSDEHANNMIIYNDRCAYEPNFYCFERICFRRFFSCGDGVCLLNGVNRFRGSRNDDVKYTCPNQREINYMCELHGRLWTTSKGFCMPMTDVSYGNSTDQNSHIVQRCLFLLQCLLSNNINVDCPCSGRTRSCIELLKRTCSLLSYVPYPIGPLLNSYLTTYYNVTRSNWNTFLPDTVYFEGSIKCKLKLIF